MLDRPPRRSGKTDLTDDELLLLDAIAFNRPRFEDLRKKEYEHYNEVYYSHGLDDEGLQSTLERLQEAGSHGVELLSLVWAFDEQGVLEPDEDIGPNVSGPSVHPVQPGHRSPAMLGPKHQWEPPLTQAE